MSGRPGTALPLRARLAAVAGQALAAASRAAGRGSGSVIGGHAILAVEPRALEVFANGREVALVSGTNGKTTTTRLLVAALVAAAGTEVVTNVAGANLPTGLATALASGPPGVPAVLEVDEAWLGRVSAQVHPSVMVLLNLSRDQLDRNNEVRQVSERWRHACAALLPPATVVANADDPLVAWAASSVTEAAVIWVSAGLGWKNDAAGCPRCGGRVAFAGAGNDWAIDWKCEECGFARPQPDIWLDGAADGRATLVTPAGSYELALRLPGRANRANAASAAGAVLALHHSVAPALAAMSSVDQVGGRYATVELGGARQARLLLAKNPAGWAEVFDMLSPPPSPVVIAINARTADGHDPSWLWDVPFERLQGRPVVATGERYLDLAARLHYGGLAPETEREPAAALQRAAGAGGGGGQIDVVANYTAFHDILRALDLKVLKR